MMANTGVDVQTQYVMALTQLSEEDRREFLRLIEKYGVDILAQALYEDDLILGKYLQKV
jgi:hypothetical protein